MNFKQKQLHPCRLRVLMVAICAGVSMSAAWAEAPMNTDDAGTLDKGGVKLEAIRSRDAQTNGTDLVFGYGAAEGLELELSLAGSRDGSVSPATKSSGYGLGVKWVPTKNDTGWSLGARVDLGSSRITDYVTPDRFTEREYAVTGLASYRLQNGQVLHLNLGAVQVRAQGANDTAGAWGIGYEIPVTERLKFTAETFGRAHSRPDKAVGLRYEFAEGLKLSVAWGSGSGRTFGQVGFAWAF